MPSPFFRYLELPGRGLHHPRPRIIVNGMDSPSSSFLHYSSSDDPNPILSTAGYGFLFSGKDQLHHAPPLHSDITLDHRTIETVIRFFLFLLDRCLTFFSPSPFHWGFSPFPGPVSYLSSFLLLWSQREQSATFSP